MNRLSHLLSLVALLCTACGDVQPADVGDPAPDEPQRGHVEQATTCAASASRYPVNGPHNAGWDNAQDAYRYGYPPHGSPRDNTDFRAGSHHGLDIFAARGTTLVAVRAGTITYFRPPSSPDPTGGVALTVTDSCGWSYYYAHLSALDGRWRQGSRVSAGDRLGWSGDTGNAQGTAPHLHFSVFPDGVYARGVDPFPIINSVDGTSASARVLAHPSTVSAGQRVVQDGWGFAVNSTVSLCFTYPDGRRDCSIRKATDTTGKYGHGYTFPANAQRGLYRYYATDSTGRRSNTVSYTLR